MRKLFSGCIVVGIVLVGLTSVAGAWTTTERVNLSSSEVQANGGNCGSLADNLCDISADGRYVAFASDADNLVAGDTNWVGDIFVRDRTTGLTERVSVDSSGAQANNVSTSPSISADGRYVAFQSNATNLVAGDSNGHTDAFVHDRTTGLTERVSLDSSGTQGNDDSFSPRLSDDGLCVAFYSRASNLVAGDTNNLMDCFVHDRTTGLTERVSLDSSGVQGNDNSSNPRLSSDGRYVTFASYARNLVAGDTNTAGDIFVRDRTTGLTERDSVDSSGTQGNSSSLCPFLSADGRYVAFFSLASNLVTGDTNGVYDVFVHDRTTGLTERVSTGSSGAGGPGAQGNGHSQFPSLSTDGRYVAFVSLASNLVAGDTNGVHDVFVHDRTTGQTKRVNVSSTWFSGGGIQANANSFFSPSLSGSGRYVAFPSMAWDLVSLDTNGYPDIFVFDGAPSPLIPMRWLPMGTAVALGTNLTVNFSADMDRKSVQGALTINGVKAAAFGGKFTWKGRNMTFNPTNNLLPGTSYNVLIGIGARSTVGARLDKAFTWAFTTVPAALTGVTASASPTAAGAQITLSLASAADVSVSIRNLAGREIALLQPGQLTAGIQSLLWNGKSKTGTRAPNGTYLLQVSARTADGSSCSMLTSLRR